MRVLLDMSAPFFVGVRHRDNAATPSVTRPAPCAPVSRARDSRARRRRDGSIFHGARSTATKGAPMSDAASTPTVVLVHGAFADASSWNGVIPRLEAQGVSVTAPPNP